jgi:hypothetical protein
MKELSVLQKPADKTLHPLIYSYGFMLALGN